MYLINRFTNLQIFFLSKASNLRLSFLFLPEDFKKLFTSDYQPDEIKIYCGHEYTLKNLQFAQQVEPNNIHIKEKLFAAQILIENNQPTLPSTLAVEKMINPFLRCQDKSVIQSAERYADKQLDRAEDVFQCLREWKNNF